MLIKFYNLLFEWNANNDNISKYHILTIIQVFKNNFHDTISQNTNWGIYMWQINTIPHNLTYLSEVFYRYGENRKAVVQLNATVKKSIYLVETNDNRLDLVQVIIKMTKMQNIKIEYSSNFKIEHVSQILGIYHKIIQCYVAQLVVKI